MRHQLFDEGGPLNIRQVAPGRHEMSVTIPRDEHGMLGRECTSEACSPGYFKIMPGTGLKGPQEFAYCPYCHSADAPRAFYTSDQRAYALLLAKQEAVVGARRMIAEALGLDSRGRKQISGGFLSIEMSLNSPSAPIPPRLIEEELQRNLTCPECTLEHAVFGLATWCPDCGRDIFLEHVREELDVIRKILSAVPRRRVEMGPRVAAKDTENALEDVVSIFEAVMKKITRRYLETAGITEAQIEERLDSIGNSFQNVDAGSRAFERTTGLQLFEGADRDMLASAFAKRHPHTHNLGIVDRKYLERARTGELAGRELRIRPAEVMDAIACAQRVLGSAYERSAGRRPRDEVI